MESVLICAGFGIFLAMVFLQQLSQKRKFAQEATAFSYCETGPAARKCDRPVLLRDESLQCMKAMQSKGCCAYRKKKTGEIDHFDICEGK